jgi:hypothetical protein
MTGLDWIRNDRPPSAQTDQTRSVREFPHLRVLFRLTPGGRETVQHEPGRRRLTGMPAKAAVAGIAGISPRASGGPEAGRTARSAVFPRNLGTFRENPHAAPSRSAWPGKLFTRWITRPENKSSSRPSVGPTRPARAAHPKPGPMAASPSGPTTHGTEGQTRGTQRTISPAAEPAGRWPMPSCGAARPNRTSAAIRRRPCR